MKYRPLDMFVKQTDELKKLIAEHPDYPIVVIVANEVIGDEYCWWYAPCLRFDIGEILDCEQDVDPCVTFEDRDEFKEALEDYYYGDFDGTDSEFDKYIEKKLDEYEPYWTKCVIIYVDN